MSKRWMTFGMYSIFSHGHKVNWDKIIADLKASNYSGLSVHLFSPWGQDWAEPFFFFPHDGTKFLLNKTNQLWVSSLNEMLDKFLTAGLDLELCLWDRYYETGKTWSRYIKTHPYRANNIGVKWSNDRELFNSWLGGTVFTWIDWQDKSPSISHLWRALGKIGFANFNYATTVLDIVKGALDAHLRGRISIKVFNEQISGDTDRHEIVQWVQSEGKKRGLVTSPRFFWIYDISIRGASSEQEYKHHFWGGYTGNPKSFVKDAKTEVHSVGEEYDHDDYLSWGGEPRKMLFSTDGVPAGLNEGAIIDLWKSAMPFCDGKMEEGDVVGFKWQNKNMMKNWNGVFPHHAEYLE